MKEEQTERRITVKECMAEIGRGKYWDMMFDDASLDVRTLSTKVLIVFESQS